MIWPVEFVNHKSTVHEVYWLSIQAVAVQITTIVIDNDLWS